MKKKVLKIIFIVSFLPYIVLVLVSLYYAIFGLNIGQHSGIPDTMVVEWKTTGTIYGINAFWTMFEGLIVIYSRMVPVLPILVIYQIMYVILERIRKNYKGE